MRFRKQKHTNYAEKEHLNLHTSKIQQFVDQKTLLLVKEVDSYAIQQSLLPDQSIKLIQFNPNIILTPENDSSQKTDETNKSKKKLKEENEVESKITIIQKQIELFENLKSYVQKKLFISGEGTQQVLPETQQNEIFETRKKLLNDQFKDINNIFNLNYLPDVIQQSQPSNNGWCRNFISRQSFSSNSSSSFSSSSDSIRSRSRSRSRSSSVQREEIEQIQSKNQRQKYIQYEWFLIEQDQFKDFQGFQQYSFRNNLRYQGYYFKKSIQMDFNPLTTTIDSFYQYTDFVQTSLLDNKSPISVILDLQLDQPLSLLAILNILLTLKSFNILKIKVSGQIQKEQNKKLLEMILKSAICQRSLQQISIKVQTVLSLQDFALALSSAMSNCDLEKSFVRVFGLDLNYYDDNQNLQNNNNLNNLFYQISRFNMLYHLSATKLPITKQNVENFNKIVKLVTSAKLLQMSTELKFSAPNLTNLKLQYNFRSSEEEHVKYDHFKDLTNLQKLDVNYSTQIDITSRKEIYRLSKKKLAKKNQDNKNDSQAQEDESESKLFQFDNLVRLNQLRILSIQLKGQQNIIDSFIEFVRQSQFLREVKVEVKQKNQDDLDYSLLFPVIDTKSCLNMFSLQTDYYGSNIHFKKVKDSQEFYSLQTNCIPSEFSLKNATQMTLNFYLDKSQLMQQLDNIYQSLKNSTKLKQVKLQVDVNFEVNEYVKYEIARSDLKLFSHLIDLKELEIFEVNQFFNQYLIMSLSSFIEYSQSLKVLRISRNFYKQLYLDFSQLFKSISVSQTIEQVSINLLIEKNTIKKQYAKTWNETKIKNFYQPLCYMIEYSQSNLLFIQYQDNYDNQGVKLILEALLKLKHTKYFTFEQQVINQISSSMKHDQQLKQLFFEVYQKGCLVKPNYNFKMAHKF